MTQDEIIEMARQAAAQITIQANGDVFYSFYGIELEAFAALIAAKEREECAVACEKELEYWGWNIVFDSAKLIRNRGEK
jgi:glutamine phosphoribosylpyrophosphate amidotransferase